MIFLGIFLFVIMVVIGTFLFLDLVGAAIVQRGQVSWASIVSRSFLIGVLTVGCLTIAGSLGWWAP